MIRKTAALLLALGVILLLCTCGKAAESAGLADSASLHAFSVPEAGREEAGLPAADICFTSDISVDGLIKIYGQFGWTASGKTAVKISMGEPPASNYLRPCLRAIT